MPPAMNLAELFVEGDYRFQMGLRRGSAAEFFRPTTQHVALVNERQHWLREEPEKYSACQATAEPLLEECVHLACEWGSISEAQRAELGTIVTPVARIIALGGMWEPDFLLLRGGDAGRFELAGGGVCFPSSWSLTEKVGQPMDFIHAPVPGLNAQLGRSIDTFLAKLTPGAAWFRHNWGLSRSAELNQHPSRALPRLDAAVAPGEVWLRIEHQALVALPRTRGILFAIRIAMHPLAEVKRDAAAATGLARALRSM
jgi:dimethylamine monooxygenase subunit A